MEDEILLNQNTSTGCHIQHSVGGVSRVGSVSAVSRVGAIAGGSGISCVRARGVGGGSSISRVRARGVGGGSSVGGVCACCGGGSSRVGGVGRRGVGGGSRGFIGTLITEAEAEASDALLAPDPLAINGIRSQSNPSNHNNVQALEPAEAAFCAAAVAAFCAAAAAEDVAEDAAEADALLHAPTIAWPTVLALFRKPFTEAMSLSEREEDVRVELVQDTKRRAEAGHDSFRRRGTLDVLQDVGKRALFQRAHIERLADRRWSSKSSLVLSNGNNPWRYPDAGSRNQDIPAIVDCHKQTASTEARRVLGIRVIFG
ncbi:hypothetical protein CVT25_014264 [Psilocybe cyanescens]|uniref:Uncharacterized protein n=1 Tax=Psilocybe cyanescens TaxID=93625 RepID=A0A409VP92_PSICY|nr:hypothetical protein CVT25_014264 [Psilocybe cyanescens]